MVEREVTAKSNAVLFSLSGLSLPRIAFLLRVSVQVVLLWLSAFAQA
jgi:hypothetical protein